MAEAWTLVVPIKHPGNGKTRLHNSLRSRSWAAEPVRLAREIAEAIARDCLNAICGARGVTRVLLVTDDTDWTHGLPVDVIAQTTPRLDGAIDDALRFAHGRTGIILGDLPGLGSAELDEALNRASEIPLGLVADAHGTGTTLITAAEASAHQPRFGADSADSHRKSGYRDLDVPCGSGLRFDVDTIDDLLGLDWSRLGPLTAAVLRRSGLSVPLAAALSSTTSPLPTPSREIGAPL